VAGENGSGPLRARGEAVDRPIRFPQKGCSIGEALCPRQPGPPRRAAEPGSLETVPISHDS
jgi:hypothetical protein